MNTDKFNYFSAETKDPVGKYTQPKDYDQADTGKNGYPNAIPSTQTQKTRGTGAATKATKHSTKMG